jgi:hypothetical protein
MAITTSGRRSSEDVVDHWVRSKRDELSGRCWRDRRGSGVLWCQGGGVDGHGYNGGLEEKDGPLFDALTHCTMNEYWSPTTTTVRRTTKTQPHTTNPVTLLHRDTSRYCA